MGHRALVAYERTDGTYNLHYTHWGALDLRLRHEITAATPFGGERRREWPTEVHAELTAGTEPAMVQERFDLEAAAGTDVEPLPLETDVTLTAVVSDYLDYVVHEACYVVDRELQVTAYRTLWFGLEYAAICIAESPTVGHGALQPVQWHDGKPVGDGFTRGQFSGMKQVVGEMVDRGLFDRDGALEYLQGKLFSTTGAEVRVSLAV